ncbi:MAG: carbohydrate binding domain-containing protein, partial [Candidatus Omnitrophota bacterium]|nr:carbohydrate binding domain-containing protein [Candidatus Omnitrophota bacterium]
LGKEIERGPGVTELLDIRRYNYLSFWIKGLGAGEEIKLELHQDIDNDGRFVFGKDITSFVYVTDYLPEGRIGLTWQKALIPLKDFTDLTDISKMIELVFVFENKKGDTKGAVYIDDILFGRRPDDILSAEYINEIQPPVESSFRINGKSAKFCPAFEASNELTIKAESLAENPFIESVRFEYSIDGGYVWRAIGADYGAGKDLYAVKWAPGHFYQSRDYKVRAVAIDIFGNQRETGALIECGVKPPTDEELLDLIQRKAFDFFLEHQNAETGLFADTTGGGDASIASTGFGITALLVGAERGWIAKDEARRRAALALDAFLPKSKGEEPLVEGKYGFFYHFVNMHN